MIVTIMNTIKSHLTYAMSRGRKPGNSRKIRIIIADFNVDYPSTYVLIEQENLLYDIALHDVADAKAYDDKGFEKAGYYPVGIWDPSEPSALLKSRIKKHGIVKEVDIQW
jgi:hypothetical protein